MFSTNLKTPDSIADVDSKLFKIASKNAFPSVLAFPQSFWADSNEALIFSAY
jgi:hypothetical protein